MLHSVYAIMYTNFSYTCIWDVYISSERLDSSMVNNLFSILLVGNSELPANMIALVLHIILFDPWFISRCASLFLSYIARRDDILGSAQKCAKCMFEFYSFCMWEYLWVFACSEERKVNRDLDNFGLTFIWKLLNALMLRDIARYTQNTLTYVCMILCTNNDTRLK